MRKPKVLVVYKESAYSRFLASGNALRNLKKGNYWKIIRVSHERQKNTLQGVRQALKAEGLKFKWIKREQVHRLGQVDSRFGLVISVGGDGTLLDSSHHVGKTPILGVNSDPARSVARFSGCDLSTFPRVLKGYLDGKESPSSVPRLEFSVNGKKNKWLVLNDLLVATLSPGGTSRYVLKVGNRVEEQLSSGIWISTAAGSTAALYSAGGKVLPVLSKKIQFGVREAYQKKFGPRRLLKGVLNPGQKIEVTSQMKEGRIFVDGANLSVPFLLGDRLKIHLSSKPLRIIGLKR
jgi:NAD+ kinase